MKAWTLEVENQHLYLEWLGFQSNPYLQLLFEFKQASRHACGGGVVFKLYGLLPLYYFSHLLFIFILFLFFVLYSIILFCFGAMNLFIVFSRIDIKREENAVCVRLQ